MNNDKAVDSSAVDAKAVLALGPQLEWWTFVAGKNRVLNSQDLCNGDEWYIIGIQAETEVDQAVYRTSRFSRLQISVPSNRGPDCICFADAKAACERHFASGKWEC